MGKMDERDKYLMNVVASVLRQISADYPEVLSIQVPGWTVEKK